MGRLMLTKGCPEESPMQDTLKEPIRKGINHVQAHVSAPIITQNPVLGCLSNPPEPPQLSCRWNNMTPQQQPHMVTGPAKPNKPPDRQSKQWKLKTFTLVGNVELSAQEGHADF
eukprot:Gb_38663 [translate_table: standard]